jgi:Fis family transcriptional regulator, factor for inversion stimulation protein
METAMNDKSQAALLRTSVSQSIEKYLVQVGESPVNNLYDLVLGEIEEPLLRAVLSHTKFNQSRAANVLGLSRGTLRKKLKQYGIL